MRDARTDTEPLKFKINYVLLLFAKINYFLLLFDSIFKQVILIWLEYNFTILPVLLFG